MALDDIQDILGTTAHAGDGYEFASCSESCGDDSVDGTHVFRGPVIV